MAVPQWLKPHLGDADLDSIRESIATAEKKTSGEIVALVVHRSALFGHVRPMLFAFTALALLLIGEEISYMLVWHPGIIAIISVLAALVISFLLGHFDSVRRWLTTNEDLALSVFRRAELEFFETGIPGTAGRTGVLIMISMAEHRAVILGDEAISKKIAETVWVQTVERMLAKIKSGDLKSGLNGAINEMGEILQREFPLQAGDKNELADHLLIKE